MLLSTTELTTSNLLSHHLQYKVYVKRFSIHSLDSPHVSVKFNC